MVPPARLPRMEAPLFSTSVEMVSITGGKISGSIRRAVGLTTAPAGRRQHASSTASSSMRHGGRLAAEAWQPGLAMALPRRAHSGRMQENCRGGWRLADESGPLSRLYYVRDTIPHARAARSPRRSADSRAPASGRRETKLAVGDTRSQPRQLKPGWRRLSCCGCRGDPLPAGGCCGSISCARCFACAAAEANTR